MPAVIEIPDHALVVLCGPAACGKSTFAAKHFPRAQIISSDQCRELVSDDADNQACSGDAFTLLYAIMRARLKFRRLTVVDSTALSTESRANLLKIASEFGTPTVLIFFRVPLAVCLERNERRERRVPLEVVQQQCEQAEEAARSIYQQAFSRIYELRTEEIDTAQLVVASPRL